MRTAEADAARWQARAEALAAALDQARNRDAAESLAGLPGVVGPLVDHLEIDAGAERAVTALLGDALGALVVDGPVAARQALARLADGDTAAVVLVADTTPVAPLDGTRGAGRTSPRRPRPLLGAGCGDRGRPACSTARSSSKATGRRRSTSPSASRRGPS